MRRSPGLPVQVGLYTAFVPMAIYAMLGTSRPLSVSTTTTIAILTGAALGTVAHGARVGRWSQPATLALLVGRCCSRLVLRLGFVANFISEPVLVGFKAGIGLVIVVDQFPKLLGLHIDKTGFLRDLFASLGQPAAYVARTLAVSAALVVLIFGLEHFVPRARAARRRGGGDRGARPARPARAGVETVGAVPSGLPYFTWPDLALVAGAVAGGASASR